MMKSRPGLLALLALGFLLASMAHAQPESAVGNVRALSGQAYAIRADATEVGLAPGIEVFRADTIQTLANALLELEMIDGSSFTLDENTRVALAEYVTDVEPRGRLGLLRGRMRSAISTTFSSRSDSFQVETTEGVMGVQGTDFLIEAPPNETRVYVYEGLVLVTSRDPNFPDGVLLGPGQFIRVRLGEPLGEPIPFYVTIPDPAEDPLGSGGSQQLRSGGDQGNDPLQQVPEFSPLRVPPLPRPPDGPDG